MKNQIIAVMMALLAWACDGGPATPSSNVPSGSTTPIDHPVPTPVLTAISPNVGSASGGTPVTLTASGLSAGITVMFDGVAVPARFDGRYTDRVYLDTPPHAPGTVDIVATNRGGQPGRLAAAYTYAAPASFDFNGTWSGFPHDGSDLLVEFTIQNNTLVRVSCDTTVVTFADPVPVANGAFSFDREGSSMSGKIVSASQAVGAIAVAPCDAPLWIAERVR